MHVRTPHSGCPTRPLCIHSWPGRQHMSRVMTQRVCSKGQVSRVNLLQGYAHAAESTSRAGIPRSFEACVPHTSIISCRKHHAQHFCLPSLCSRWLCSPRRLYHHPSLQHTRSARVRYSPRRRSRYRELERSLTIATASAAPSFRFSVHTHAESGIVYRIPPVFASLMICGASFVLAGMMI